MQAILQVEFSDNLAQTRKEILVRQGYAVKFLIGFEQVRTFGPEEGVIDLVVIGHAAQHAAHWNERN